MFFGWLYGRKLENNVNNEEKLASEPTTIPTLVPLLEYVEKKEQ
jgi:hypothetical protein